MSDDKPVYALLVGRVQDRITDRDSFQASVVIVRPDGNLRNPSDHYGESEQFADLLIEGSIERDDKITDRVAFRVWWLRLEYRSPYSVNTERAALMLKTLRKIESGVAKLESKFGRPDSFASYLTRVAETLGINEYRVKASGDHWSYDGNEYRAFDGAGITRWLHGELNPPTEITHPDGSKTTVYHA